MPRPKEIDFGFVHEDSKIWELDIPSEAIPIYELEHNLDIPYLDKKGTDDWNLTLRELITHPDNEPGHYEKIKDAQMEYPIEIYFFNGSWKILDGVHRFCKAIMENRQTIAVRKITDKMIPRILKKIA